MKNRLLCKLGVNWTGIPWHHFKTICEPNTKLIFELYLINDDGGRNRQQNAITQNKNSCSKFENFSPLSQSLKVAKSTDLYDFVKVALGSKSMHSQFCLMSQYSIFSRDPLIDEFSNSAFLEISQEQFFQVNRQDFFY